MDLTKEEIKKRWQEYTEELYKKDLKEPLDEGERGKSKSWLKIQHSKNKDHGMWSDHFMANRWGNNRNSERPYFLGLQSHCRW